MHSNGSVLKPLSKPPTAPPLGSAHGGVGSGGASTGSGSNSTVSLAHRAIESFNNKVQSLSTKLPKKAWQDEVTSDDDGEWVGIGLRKVLSTSPDMTGGRIKFETMTHARLGKSKFGPPAH